MGAWRASSSNGFAPLSHDTYSRGADFVASPRAYLSQRCRAAFARDAASRYRYVDLPNLNHNPTDLLRAAQRGERGAQRELYDAYAALVFGIALRYGRTRSEAEDFSQEAWMLAFAKLDRFRDEGSFEGWLRRLTVNCCLSALRRRGLDLAEMPMVLPAGTHTEPGVFSQLNAEELIAHIAALPTGYRLVFNLVAVEGYTHAEAAAALGISESSSRSQLTRARAALQGRLAQSAISCH